MKNLKTDFISPKKSSLGELTNNYYLLGLTTNYKIIIISRLSNRVCGLWVV